MQDIVDRFLRVDKGPALPSPLRGTYIHSRGSSVATLQPTPSDLDEPYAVENVQEAPCLYERVATSGTIIEIPSPVFISQLGNYDADIDTTDDECL